MIRYFAFALIAFLNVTTLLRAAEPEKNFCRPMSAFYRDQRLPSQICVTLPTHDGVSEGTVGVVTLLRDGVILDRQNFKTFLAQGKGYCNHHTGECYPGRRFIAVTTADSLFRIDLNVTGVGLPGAIFTGTVSYLPDQVLQYVQ